MNRRLPGNAVLMTVALLGVTACSGDDWSGEWTVKEVHTPMTGANINPLKEAMLGRTVQLSESKIVLPHYTKKGEEMVISVERVGPNPDSSGVVLYPPDGSRYLDGSLIVTTKPGDRVILHGVPRNGPSANFFLYLER